MRPKPQSSTLFPPAWAWFIDEAVPSWVKAHYSPKETWKNKPFAKEDVQFFFKGIQELSLLFTEERPKGMPQYFHHPKYRSSYILYFLPLQMAKFLTLYELHSSAIEAAMEEGWKTGTLRIADLGAGPGTASMALLLLILNFKLSSQRELPKIEFYWFDQNKEIMADGQALVELIASNFPKLRGKVSVHTHTLPWWKATSVLPNDLALTIFGHVLNESTAPAREADLFWQKIFEKTQGGGVLMVEPATRKAAQTLAYHRDHFFEAGWVEQTPTRIWGPCLHAGTCPLAQGRDWCHFSFPAAIPGKWFKKFSEALSSERFWVKLTYLWVASPSYPAPNPSTHARRVISDPLNQGDHPSVLICEPETAKRYSIHPKTRVGRGDIIKI